MPALWPTQNYSPTPRRNHFKLQCFYEATWRPENQGTSLRGTSMHLDTSFHFLKVEFLGANKQQ